jgi:hypothetical protein
MTKLIRFTLASVVILFNLAAIETRAQSSSQAISFSVLAEYEFDTNDVVTEPGLTDQYARQLLLTTGSVVKAIMLDLKGRSWTNWIGAALQRRVNLLNGHEGIYITRGGTNEVDVSSFFGDSYVSNFTADVMANFPNAANNFNYNGTNLPSPYPPLFSGAFTSSKTNLTGSAGFHFITLNTTNLKMNLLGVSFRVPGEGGLTTFSGPGYSQTVETEIITVLGAFVWNQTTNFYAPVTDITNTFYSGPAHGNVAIGLPVRLLQASPP